MMKMQLSKKFSTTLIATAIASFSSSGFTAGFALLEQNASGLGNAYAGMSATAEDASTVYFNPAGMSYLKGRQFVGAVNFIKPGAKFSNTNSTTIGSDGGDAGDWAAVPSLYLTADINSQWKFGLGINSPFGLVTDYNAGWKGRYQGLKSDLMTININPSVSFKANEKLSLGAGINAQYVKGELTKAINFNALVPGTPDGHQSLKATDWGWGFNLGAIYQATPDTRIGFAYRSEINYTLDGDSTFTGTPGALAGNLMFRSSHATADLDLPASAALSFVTALNPKVDLMGDITWTGWNSFKELRVKFANGAVDNVTPENWTDSWRIGLGATYKYTDQWKLRGGVAYDQTPVSDEYRTVRIPDEDRVWISIGATYQPTKQDTLSFGYAHLFVSDASINKTEPPIGGRVTGNYDNQVNILAIQYSRSF